MKYVQINSNCLGWADAIIFKKHKELQANGDQSYVFWARGDHEQDKYMQKIASYPEVCLDALQVRLDGKSGFHSKGITKRLLNRLDQIDPDVVHLHTLTGYYINVEMLFEWLAAHRCEVIWTQHDCWAFTGHCIHFVRVNCDQWKTCCGRSRCPQLSETPKTYCKSTVKWNFENKRRLFTLIPKERMTLIAPSDWLARLLRESFLKEYPIKVVKNTPDTSVFRHIDSDFRARSNLEKKFIVLGVAAWTERKGLYDMLRLAKDLGEDSVVILVGLKGNERLDLPSNVLAYKFTNDKAELAKVYSAANVFFNPTQEDNFPTVNLEAEACGTPVITYNIGGCAETIHLKSSKAVKDYEEGFNLIKQMRDAFLEKCHCIG